MFDRITASLRRLAHCAVAALLMSLFGIAEATILTVTTTVDTGVGSLRAALTTINADTGCTGAPYDINFNIAAPPYKISPASILPLIGCNTFINGYSQPGTAVNTLVPNTSGSNAVIKIELDGLSCLTLTCSGLSFGAGASNSRVTGLAIGGFRDSGEAGITISGASNIEIWGNFIGLAADGITLNWNKTGVFATGATGLMIGNALKDDRNIFANDSSSIASIWLTAGASFAQIRDNRFGFAANNSLTYSPGNNAIRLDGVNGTSISHINRIFCTNKGINILGSSNNTNVENTGVHGCSIGIDIGDNGPTGNASLNATNHPVVTSVKYEGNASTTIEATFSAAASNSYSFGYFSTSAFASSKIGEEGIGSDSVTTDDGGNAATSTFGTVPSIGVVSRVFAGVVNNPSVTANVVEGPTSEFSFLYPTAKITTPPATATLNSASVGGPAVTTTVTIFVDATSPTSWTLDSASFAGTNASEFALQSHNCNSIAAGDNCNLIIAFTPAGMAGARTGNSLTLTSNAPIPTISLVAAALGAVTAAPTSINFGNVSVETLSAVQTITITNPSTNPLAVTSIGFSQAHFSNTTTGSCNTSIPASSSCIYSIRFDAPASQGNYMSNFVVNTPLGNISVPLAASGTAFSVSATPAPVVLGSVGRGQKSGTINITFANTGTGSALITAATIVGTNAGDFTKVADTCNAGIAAGGTCTATMRFEPTAMTTAGAKTADLEVTFGNALLYVPLQGTAVIPSLSITPGMLSFSSSVGIASATQTVSIQNTGTVPVPITSIVPSSTIYFDSTTPIENRYCGLGASGSGSFLLGVGATCTLNMVFQPVANGAANGTLTIDGTGFSSALTVILNGIGLNALEVTNTSDTGVGSLRSAINYVNTNCGAGGHTITFNIPGMGPHKIQPATVLPDILCKDITIDGYTQSGAVANTNGAGSTNAIIKIWLDGALQAGGQGLHFPYLGSQANTGAGLVRGLAITRFDVGVKADYAARVSGSFIGVEPDGVTPAKNAVGVFASSSTTLGPCCVKVGGPADADVNLISATATGVVVEHVSAQVERNLFGYDRSCTAVAALGSNIAINSTPGMTSFGTQDLQIINNRIAHQTRALLSGNVQTRFTRNTALSISTEVVNLGVPNITLTSVEFDGIANTIFSGSINAIGAGNHQIEVFSNPSGTTAVTQIESHVAEINVVAPMAGSVMFNQAVTGILDNPSLLLTYQDNMPVQRTFSVLGYKRPFILAALPTVFNATAGGAAVNQTLMYTNTFGADVTFGATPAALSGAGYAVTGGTCLGATIGAGLQCSIIVSYNSATVTTNVAGSLAVSLNSAAVTTIIRTALLANATALPQTTVSASSLSLTFGSSTLGVATVGQNVTITNTGTNPLIVSGTSVIGTNPSDFLHNATNCTASAVPAGMSCIITVNFQPLATGARTATLSITANAPVSPISIALSGTGTTPNISAAPTTLNFANTLVGQTSAIQNVTVTNNTATAGAPVLSLPTHIQYVTDNCGALAVGASCVFQFRFAPTLAGNLSGTIMFTHASQNASVTFAGTGDAGTGPFAYITNDASDNVSVVNITTGTVVATIPVGDGPYGVAVNPAGTRAYVTNYNAATLSVINTSTNTVIATPAIGAQSSAVVVSRDGNKVYAGANGTVSVIDATTNLVTTTIMSGRVDGLALSPGGNRLYVMANDTNTVKVYSTSTNTLLTTIAGVASALLPAMQPNGLKMYVTNYTGTTLTTIDTVTNIATTSTTLPSVQYAAVLSADGSKLYVSGHTGNAVYVIDTASGNVVATLPVAGTPLGLSLDDSGTRLVVARRDSNAISIFDTASNMLLSTVTVGNAPHAVGQFMQRAPATVIAPTITTSTLAGAGLGVPYTASLSATGTGPYDWSISAGALPAGLVLDGLTGIITGTPSAAGTSNFTVQASNGTSNSTEALSIVVLGPLTPPVVAFSYAPATITTNSSSLATLTITNPNATAGTANAFTLSYPTGVVNTATPVVASTCPGAMPTAVANAGSFASGTSFTIPASGSCTFSVNVTSAVAATYNGVIAGGLITTAAGGSNALATTLTVTVPVGAAPVITSSPPPSAQVNGGYNFTPSATGAATITWSIPVGSLPPGLSLNVMTGAITGTPNTAGNFAFTLRATNGVGQANQATAITVSAPVLSVMSIEPASLNFGNQNLGTTSVPQVVTVSNTGNASLTVNSITGIGDFAHSSNCGALSPSASCTINVTFTPLTAGPLTGLISVNSTAQGGANSINLSGNGVAVPRANIRINPSGIDFGNQAVGTSSVVQILFISNTGLATLNMADISITGSGLSSFTRTAAPASENPANHLACGGTLAPGASCAMGILFAPSATGLQTAALSVRHNATLNGELSTSDVPLTGNGTARREAILRVGSALSFGDQVIGTSSAAQSLSLSNSGTIPLSIASIIVSQNATGTSAADFSIGGSCSTLAPNTSCVLDVRFTPVGSAGSRAASVVITSNASNGVAVSGGNSTISVGLGGNALAIPAPVVRLSATSIGFGNLIKGGATASQRVTISNVGGLPLNVSSVNISGDFALSHTCTTPVQPNLSCHVDITFNPVSIGTRNGTLTIVSNATPTTNTVAVSGTGCLQPSIGILRTFVNPCGN